MTDLASLVLEVDSTQVPKGTAALDSLTAAGKKAETQTNATTGATKKLAAANDEAVRSLNRNGYAVRNLGQQFQDFGTQALNGAGVLRAFSQQIGQVGYAMSEFESGPLKSVGSFLAGPWGIALTLAAQAVAALTLSLDENEKSAAKVEKAARDAAKAHDFTTLSVQELTKATDDLVDAQYKAHTSQEQGFRDAVASAQALWKEVEAKRAAAAASLQHAIALAKENDARRSDGSEGDITQGVVGAALERKIKGYEADLAELTKTTTAAGQAFRTAQADLANFAIATDKNTKAQSAYKDAVAATTKAYADQKITPAERDKQFAAEYAALKAVTDADKNAAAAKREHNKETREAAKAARDAAKAQAEYYKTVMGGAALRGLNNMGDIITPKELAASVHQSAAQIQAELDARRAGQDRLNDLQRQEDEERRGRLLDTAHDFAEVIGGGFGRAIQEMVSLIDHAAAIFRAGTPFEKAIAGAGIGGAAASATGGSGLGGSIGGAIGQKLGEKFLTKALGDFAGPIGAIAGGLLGGVIGGMFHKVKKASATIEIMAGEATQTAISGNSSKLKATASAMASSLISGLSSIADQLGGVLGNNLRVSIGQRDKTFRVDLSGMGRTKGMPKFDTEQEAVEYAVSELLRQGAITGLRAGTETLLKGQGDVEARLQKALSFEQVFKDLEQQTNPAKASIDAITKSFTALLDIFDEAKASADDYAKLQELMAMKQKEALEQAFEPIRTMLDDLKSKADAAGDAVKAAYDKVLSDESTAISAYNEAVAAQQKAARDAFNAGQQRWLDLVTTGFSEEIDRVKSSMEPLRQEVDRFTSLAKGLRDFAASISPGGMGAVQFSAAAALAAAQAGDIDRLNALRSSVTSGASDRVTMLRNLAILRNAANGAAGGFEGQASESARQLAAAEQQVAGIEQQIEIAKTQVKTMDEVAGDTADIATLLKNMQTAVAAADLAREQMTRLGELNETEKSFAETVADYEKAKADRDDLIRQITEAGFAGMIEAQKQTGAELLAGVTAAQAAATQASADAAAAIAASQAAAAAAAAANDNNPWSQYINNIPQFASGGMHSGGLRIVGENGWEVAATGPERIWNAEQIGGAMNAGMAAEMRALREEVSRMRADMKALGEPIVFNTGQTARDLRGTLKAGVLVVQTDSDNPLATVAA